jgi:integrase/recombinase XerD
LHRLGAKAGIEKRVHPHALRHSMAFDLMWEGVPVPLIQAQLGHASLATTQRYLDHLAPKDLVDAMQRREFEV